MFFSTLCFCNTRAGVLPRLGVICLSPQTRSVKVRRGSNAAGRSASCGAHDSPCSELGFAVSCNRPPAVQKVADAREPAHASMST